MYAHIHVGTCTCTFTYIHIHVHRLHTHHHGPFTRTQTHVHTHTHTYTHIHIHTHIYMYTHIHIHTHMCMFTQIPYVHRERVTKHIDLLQHKVHSSQLICMYIGISHSFIYPSTSIDPSIHSFLHLSIHSSFQVPAIHLSI